MEGGVEGGDGWGGRCQTFFFFFFFLVQQTTSGIDDRRHFQHAHFIPIVGVEKRGEY